MFSCLRVNVKFVSAQPQASRQCHGLRAPPTLIATLCAHIYARASELQDLFRNPPCTTIMPTLSPPATVLVTGANGYVGCWVVRALLEKGYTVLGAVRTKEKADALFTLISSKHPSCARAFDCLVIPDIAAVSTTHTTYCGNTRLKNASPSTQEDAIDPFLEGVHGVVHTATPVTFALEDPEAYIRPAVDGTLGILRAATKHKYAG